jgi:hypothetical protein
MIPQVGQYWLTKTISKEQIIKIYDIDYKKCIINYRYILSHNRTDFEYLDSFLRYSRYLEPQEAQRVLDEEIIKDIIE